MGGLLFVCECSPKSLQHCFLPHPPEYLNLNLCIFSGILPKEKPLEIKTVRIVKRESTERRKDRSTGGKRVTIGDSSLTHLLEDDVESDGFSDVENEPPMPSFAARLLNLFQTRLDLKCILS